MDWGWVYLGSAGNALSRDTDNAHEKLNTIFDKEKEQKRIEKTQLVGELGKQITDIAVTEKRIPFANMKMQLTIIWLIRLLHLRGLMAL